VPIVVVGGRITRCVGADGQRGEGVRTSLAT
jgi:hypothetical protein